MELRRALTLLQIYAPLRYAGARELPQLFIIKAVICGVSVGRKSTIGDVTQWTTPLKGITDAQRVPILTYWGESSQATLALAQSLYTRGLIRNGDLAIVGTQRWGRFAPP